MNYKMAETNKREYGVKLYQLLANDELVGEMSASEVHQHLVENMQLHDTYQECWSAKKYTYQEVKELLKV